MPSDYTGSPDTYNATLSLLTGSDPQTAQIWRDPYERLLDNTAFLRQQSDAAVMRQALALRKRDVTFTDTNSQMAAVTLTAEENAAGPVFAIKVGQAMQAVHDYDDTEDGPGGNVPSIGLVRDAACDSNGRIVIVGSSSPYTAFKASGGSWTNGGSQPGGSLSQVVYSAQYGGFLTSRTTNVWRSTTGVSWASTPTGLAGVQRLAVIGAGGGAGRIVALSTAATPTMALSVNNGASFSAAGGTVPYAAEADEAGSLASCPLVTRLGLDRYVYHVARCNSGQDLKLARSQDGVTWDAGPVISAGAGRSFAAGVTLHICKTTGLIVLVAQVSITGESYDYTSLYMSTDFSRWLGPATAPDGFLVTSFAVAGGRLLCTRSDELAASDGISRTVYT